MPLTWGSAVYISFGLEMSYTNLVQQSSSGPQLPPDFEYSDMQLLWPHTLWLAIESSKTSTKEKIESAQDPLTWYWPDLLLIYISNHALELDFFWFLVNNNQVLPRPQLRKIKMDSYFFYPRTKDPLQSESLEQSPSPAWQSRLPNLSSKQFQVIRNTAQQYWEYHMSKTSNGWCQNDQMI